MPRLQREYRAWIHAAHIVHESRMQTRAATLQRKFVSRVTVAPQDATGDSDLTLLAES